MTQYYLVNKINTANGVMLPGTLVDDAITATAPILAAGGELHVASDATVAAAAVAATSAHVNKGMNEDDMESLMRSAVDTSQQATAGTNATAVAANTSGLATATAKLAKFPAGGIQATTVTLASGTVTKSTGIVITAASVIVPVLTAHGGTAGARYAVSGKTVGAAGTGAFTLTAVDAAGATVATDTSVFDILIVG